VFPEEQTKTVRAGCHGRQEFTRNWLLDLWKVGLILGIALLNELGIYAHKIIPTTDLQALTRERRSAEATVAAYQR